MDNVVTGFGETALAALATHDGVDNVAFTGPTELDKLIVRAASSNLKKVSLELNGQSPNIVFAGVAEQAAAIKVGPGLEPETETEMGTLVSQAQLDRVTGYIRTGEAEGARALAGGRALDPPGYFVQPTVLVDTDPSSTVVKEEILRAGDRGHAFTDVDDLARQANASEHGLARRHLDAGHLEGSQAGQAPARRDRLREHGPAPPSRWRAGPECGARAGCGANGTAARPSSSTQ